MFTSNTNKRARKILLVVLVCCVLVGASSCRTIPGAARDLGDTFNFTADVFQPLADKADKNSSKASKKREQRRVTKASDIVIEDEAEKQDIAARIAARNSQQNQVADNRQQ